MSQDSERTTVELPANHRVARLAHEIHKEEAEWAAPLLADFMQYLAELDGDQPRSKQQLREALDSESEIPPDGWNSLMQSLVDAGYVDEEVGSTNLYTLEED